MLIILGAAVAAGMIGALGPIVLARIPEPAEPAEGKRPYAELASTRGLSIGLGLVAALAAGVAATLVEPRVLIPVWVAISGVGVLLAFVDWHTKLLPYLLVLPLNAVVLVLVVVAAALEGDWSILNRSLIAAVIVFALFWLSNRFYPRGLGYGDVRLSFGLALALGAIGSGAVVFGIWVGFALGAVCSILLARLKVIDARDFAFGPYLILGALLGACWGTSVLGSL